MIAFELRSQKEVIDLYSVALDAGGSEEGASRAFARFMDLSFMLATFVTPKVIKSHGFPAIQTDPNPTDKARGLRAQVSFQTVPQMTL